MPQLQQVVFTDFDPDFPLEYLVCSYTLHAAKHSLLTYTSQGEVCAQQRASPEIGV